MLINSHLHLMFFNQCVQTLNLVSPVPEFGDVAVMKDFTVRSLFEGPKIILIVYQLMNFHELVPWNHSILAVYQLPSMQEIA